MATTLQKISALVEHARTLDPAELAPEARDIAELLQIANGFGIDPLGALIPKTEAEADVLIDKLLTLLHQIRGDDLPPFDPDRYGEADL